MKLMIGPAVPVVTMLIADPRLVAVGHQAAAPNLVVVVALRLAAVVPVLVAVVAFRLAAVAPILAVGACLRLT